MYKYDFGLSFAKEQREMAEKLAVLLKNQNINVFYDDYEQADLWGEDLYQEFQNIYGVQCRFFIPFISAQYIERLWPKHELKQAQARDFKSDTTYILPLRFDDTIVPGLNDTTGYIDFRTTTMEKVAELCLTKLIKNSSIRELFIFLKICNPETLTCLKSDSRSFTIRVATAKAKMFQAILDKISPNICSGRNCQNYLMSGGGGVGITSLDPEPHTTFILNFSDEFYKEINI